jgi:putative heme-binding domain-containing protein
MRAAILLFLGGALLPAQTRQDIAAGALTFRSHCAPCHGFHAEGGRGPNLTRGEFYHGSSDRDLLSTISDGIPGTEMPGLFYSADRIRQIIAYIRSVRAPSGTAAHGSASAGEILFREKGCGACHRVKGVGGRLGPDLTNIGTERSTDYLRESILKPNAQVARDYWVATLQSKDRSSVQGYLLNEDTYTIQFIDFSGQLHSVSKDDLNDMSVEKTSKMPSYEGKLTDHELEDLVTYLSSLRPRRGVQ